jgi:hypothetical protein
MLDAKNIASPEGHPALPAYQEVDDNRPLYEAAIDLKADEAAPLYPGQAMPSAQPHLFAREMLFNYSKNGSPSYLRVADNKPLYAVQTPRWNMGWADINLLSGPSESDSVMATVSPEKGFKPLHTTMSLMHQPSDPPVEVVMFGNHTAKKRFTIAVGPDGAQETFEWRQTTGSMVRELVNGYQIGMKLVRLDGPPMAPASGKSSAKDDLAGITSDGKSVVAVFGGERVNYSNARFRFVNEGATGVLGDVFELAAVMSFIRLFETQIYQGATVSAFVCRRSAKSSK